MPNTSDRPRRIRVQHDAPSELEADLVFGIRATGHLEDRLSDRVLTAWRHGRTTLRTDAHVSGSPFTGS
ncbi:hypothetical protein [Streptomyces sp. NPDC048385]|uniref:hypothetical protein n=1 Tax=unclassified Streptomyces TaxID=2593676 RepID=UPI0034315D12